MRAALLWLLIAIVAIGFTVSAEGSHRQVSDKLQRERDGMVALSLAFRSCDTADPVLLSATAARFGLFDDDRTAYAELLESLITRWPPGCARLGVATRRLVHARGASRGAFMQRVLAMADESAAQAALVGGAEDALHAARAAQMRAAPGVAATRRLARDVDAYVRNANAASHSRGHLPPTPFTLLYRRTVADTNAMARWVTSTIEQDLTARIAAAHRLERQTAVVGAVVLALSGALLFAFAFAFERRTAARRNAARERVERLSAEHAREEALRALALSETEFQALFERTSAGVALLDRAGATVKANAALQRMVPDLDPSVLGVTQPDYAALWSGERDGITFEAQHGTGATLRWYDVNLSVIGNAAGTPSFVMSLVRDITERKLADRVLLHQATHDGLTGLPNRRFFFDHLRDHMARASRGAVFFIDLDDFKLVNDAMGHEAGDAVLAAAARRLSTELSGCLVARLGGDEFGAFLTGADRTEVEQAARLLVAAFIPPLTVLGREVFVTITVGIAFVDSAVAHNPSLLVRDADIAMYAAKRAGRSSYAVFDERMRELVERRSLLLAEMRKAVDEQLFVVAFQPIVHLPDRSVCGYEALARWNHPQLGSIAPDEFIPIAEQTGIIQMLGEAILRKTCARVAAWAQAPHEAVQFSINVSVQQLLSPGFEERTTALVQRFGLAPSNFTLEVTEGALLAAGDSPAEALGRIKAAGFRLSVDDFGTGYSSLSYLQRFPFDELKIDRLFIAGANDDLANEPIVSMVVALGASLGVTVVAEGVETERQARRLAELGCVRAQGFLFGALSAAPARAAATH